MDRALLNWYDSNRRDLPWRRERDPYRIWVSEVMLQQTRVETATAYYLRWLERFPDLPSLAAASEEEVMAFWSGLGYYSRARNLHAAVREVAARYGGRIPADPEAFAALPGVGEYTAGAVLSIAYGLCLPAVDGNALRVLARVGAVRGDIRRPAVRREVARLAARLVPADRPGDFNQALMDLGRLVCTPQRPRCTACPVAPWCEARRLGIQELVPERPRRPAPAVLAVAVALVQGQDERIALVRRPRSGLLAGMWGLPAVELPDGAADGRAALENYIAQAYGIRIRLGEPVARARHVFSHRTWDMTAFSGTLLDGSAGPLDAGWRWLGRDELIAFPLPRAFSRILESAGLVPPGRKRR